MTPDEMSIEQIIPYLEEHGQHFTCDHNSNFDQSVCERAIYFLKQLQTEKENLRIYAGGLENAQGYLDERVANEEAENKRLRDFAEWMLRHSTDTCNAGCVIIDTGAETIKLKAEQALQERRLK